MRVRRYLRFMHHKAICSSIRSVHMLSAEVIERPGCEALCRNLEDIVGHEPGTRPEAAGNALQGVARRAGSFPMREGEFLNRQALFAQPHAHPIWCLRSDATNAATKLLYYLDPGLSDAIDSRIIVLIPAVQES